MTAPPKVTKQTRQPTTRIAKSSGRDRKLRRRGDASRKAFERYENVGLRPNLDVDDLVLNWTDETASDLEAKGALVSLSIERTIEAGSTVTMVLRDPDYLIFSEKARDELPWASKQDRARNRKAKSSARRARAAALAERRARAKRKGKGGKHQDKRSDFPAPLRVDDGWNPIMPPDRIGESMGVTLDGVPFKLVKVSHVWSTRETTLTFEDFAVYVLKRRRGAKSVKRSLVTRAQFLKSLYDEAKLDDYGYRFVCPELNVVQPIDGGKDEKASKGKGGGSSSSGGDGAPPAGARVLYIGDSLGVGTVPLLVKRVGRKYAIDHVVKGGMQSAWGVARLREKLSRKHYAVVFDMGTNDCGRWSNLEDSLDKVEKAIGDRYLILATYNGTGRCPAHEMNDNLRAWAQGKGKVLIVDWREAAQAGSLVAGDGIHGGYPRRSELFAGAIPAPSGGSRSASGAGVTRAARAASSSSKRSGSSDDGGGGGGFAGQRPTVKKQPASSAQLRLMTMAMRICDELKVTDRVREALIVACTQESSFSNLSDGDGGKSAGVLQLQPSIHGREKAVDPERCMRLFLKQGFWGKGGAIANGAKGLPSYSIAQQTQGSYDIGTNGRESYGQWVNEARRTMRLWQGGDGGSADYSTGTTKTADTDYSVTRTKAYMFKREEDENSWQAMQRLADEVRWRRFLVGRSMYYMSQERVYEQRPRYVVNANAEGLLELTFDLDWGKSVSEATLTATLDRWGAPPGAVVLLDGFGPPDGRWLISSVRRDWFEDVAELTLVQPGKAALEPAAQKVSGQVNLPGQTVRVAGKGGGFNGWPVGGNGKPTIIGTPYAGTHTIGNWQSDNAVDIGVPKGTDLLAVEDGEITKITLHPQGAGRFAGDQVTIRGKSGRSYFYGHGVNRNVKVGDKLTKGQKIGESGLANGVAHLHWGFSTGNPKEYLDNHPWRVASNDGTPGATDGFPEVDLNGDWRGTESFMRRICHPLMAKYGLQAGSQKRTATSSIGSTTGSDHYVGNKNAYATDYPTTNGAAAAKALAKHLGITGNVIGTFQRYTVKIGGARWSIQILWHVPDHYDHVHVGVQRV